MALNPISNTGRNAPMSPQVTAAGGYTLPQQVFIPHPSLQQISSGNVGSPGNGGVSVNIGNHPGTSARPLMTTGPTGVPTYGIRLAIRKASPSING
jgi:hypothetical protein